MKDKVIEVVRNRIFFFLKFYCEVWSCFYSYLEVIGQVLLRV